MKVIIVLPLLASLGLASAGVAPAPALVRTPSLDSAVIKSDRVGGNFAYSTLEGHAYAAVAPVVQRVVEPVAVTYTARQVPLGYVTVAGRQFYPGFVGYPGYPQYPAFANPIFGGGLPAAPAAPAQPAPSAPPLTGTPIDEDTVAIESA